MDIKNVVLNRGRHGYGHILLIASSTSDANTGNRMSVVSAPRRANRRFRSIRVVLALILREMATTYGRSVFGYAWAVIEPVAAIFILTMVMSLTFSSPPMGTSFTLFYATGYLPFMLYTDLAGKLSVALRFSKPLLTYPSVTFVDAILARFILNTLTHAVVFAIFITGIWLFSGLSGVVNFGAIFRSLMMASVLGLGIGTLNCVATSLFPFWERVWAILNRPLFLVSAILFTFDDVPGRFQEVLWYNPIVHFVGMMRSGFYPSYDGGYVSEVYVYVFSLTCFALGLLFMRRFYQKIMRDS